MLETGYKRIIDERIVVNLKTGNAIRGILITERRKYLVLAEAESLSAEPGIAPVKVDGLAFPPKDNIDWIQLPEGRVSGRY